MMWRPWKREHADMNDVEDAARRVRELEQRAAQVDRHVRNRDPWAARVLDTIHQRFGPPHAG